MVKLISVQITMKKSKKGLEKDQLDSEKIFIPKCLMR